MNLKVSSILIEVHGIYDLEILFSSHNVNWCWVNNLSNLILALILVQNVNFVWYRLLLFQMYDSSNFDATVITNNLYLIRGRQRVPTLID